LYGNFANKKSAEEFAEKNQLESLGVIQLGQLQQQRCISWKKTIPIPKQLMTYCLSGDS
jgi:hypothetical protein